MAIKGKKKTRGSQAKRRPAQAPRPQAYASAHTPWHRTSGGRVAIAVGVVLVLAAAGGLAAKLRSDANERTRVAGLIDDYTDHVRTLQQETAPTGAAMAAAPATPADPTFEDLGDDARDWAEAFDAAVGGFRVVAPEGAYGTDTIFRQALALYASAARTYGLAAGLEGKDAEEALARAAEQSGRATAIWGAAVGSLDIARIDFGLPASAISPPAEAAPAAPFEIEGGGEENEDGSGGDADQ